MSGTHSYIGQHLERELKSFSKCLYVVTHGDHYTLNQDNITMGVDCYFPASEIWGDFPQNLLLLILLPGKQMPTQSHMCVEKSQALMWAAYRHRHFSFHQQVCGGQNLSSHLVLCLQEMARPLLSTHAPPPWTTCDTFTGVKGLTPKTHSCRSYAQMLVHLSLNVYHFSNVIYIYDIGKYYMHALS